MASLDLFAPKLFQWEGLFVNDSSDHGGPTNMGVTLSTWRQMGFDKNGDGNIDINDLQLLTKKDVLNILRMAYWNRWRADEIRDQALAEILVDWLWCSGKWGITIPQRLMGVPEDGIVGPNTLQRINTVYPDKFLIQVYNARVAFINNIIQKYPAQKHFQRGWLNRLNNFLTIH